MNSKYAIPQLLSLITALLLFLSIPSLVLCTPTIGPIGVNPNHIELGIPTEIKISVVISDSSFIPGSANIQQRSASGQWKILGILHDNGINGDAIAGDGILSLAVDFNELVTGNIRLRVSAAFKGLLKRVFSDEFSMPVGVMIPPGMGATVNGPSGTTLIIEQGSINYEVMAGIAPTRMSDVVAPLGNIPLVAAIEIILQPTPFNTSLLPPNAPLQISVPAPLGIPEGSRLIVAQQVLSDSLNGDRPGLREQLIPVDTALVVGGNIVTQTNIFPGIFSGGLFAIVKEVGSGFATGTVSAQICLFFVCLDIPRPGVVVSNNTNTLVAVTDAIGRYTLFISGGPFTVTGFDPFRGSSGSANGVISVPNSTVMADISLSPLLAPHITREGIRNGGFERGDLSSWALSGAGRTVQQFGPTSTGVIIRPTEGQWMGEINTGTGAIGEIGSGLKQRFVVPAGVRTLRFDFNFISEEFPEFVGSIFDDDFKAIITTPNGTTIFAQVSVNQSGGFELIGDCFFPGGDDTCGQTGWREGSVDLSAFAGTNTPITVELLFSAIDAGDDIYDTHVLIDNIRFGTVWVDVKIIQGAAANQARIQNEILGATEILSQAGLNVQLRNVQTIADPGGLLDTDITWVEDCRPNFLCLLLSGTTKGVPTAEEIQLTSLARSAVATDINVYYIRSLVNEDGSSAGAGAFAFGPDDFHDVDILTNSGTFQADNGVGGNILAHEAGHLLISPESAANIFEHNAPAGNFLSTTPALGIVNRQQSANINRLGAPLLAP